MSVSTDRIGHAATFFGTREYRPGDNLRRVHWPSTLRWGRMILKEFEQDTNLEVTCFLDLNRASLRGVGRGSNVEQAVRIAASLAEHVTSRLCSFQLIADPGSPLILPARPGKQQLMAALDSLARVRPSGRTPYLDLVSNAMRLVGEGSGVVLVFNTLEVDETAMFAVLAEEFGLVGNLVVIAIYMALVFTAMSIGRAAEKQGKRFNGYLVYGLSMMLGLQAMVNVGVSSGLLPTKGLTLPLISYGGSSLIIVCVVLALIMRADYENNHNAERKAAKRTMDLEVTG